MPQPYRITVGALSVRIPEEFERNYTELLKRASNSKRGYNVRGTTYLAISSFDPEDGVGLLSKYTEIDLDGEWFDTETFGIADSDTVSKVSIPSSLKPNLSQFYFYIDPKLHIIVFETQFRSDRLSEKSAEIFFRKAFATADMATAFGKVQVDLVQSFESISDLLSRKFIRELNFIIKRPNPDDIPEDLATLIEERMREQNADIYIESLKSTDDEGINPNDRTKALGYVAAENGEVTGKAKVNGVTVPVATKDTPLSETEKFDDVVLEKRGFLTLVARIIDRIRAARARARDG